MVTKYVLPAEFATDWPWIDSWRIRAFPAFGAPEMGLIWSGQVIDVMRVDGGWLQVRHGDIE